MGSDDGVILYFLATSIGRKKDILEFAMLTLGPFVLVPEAYVMFQLTFYTAMTDAHKSLTIILHNQWQIFHVAFPAF